MSHRTVTAVISYDDNCTDTTTEVQPCSASSSLGKLENIRTRMLRVNASLIIMLL
jgi:hypothetical protein